MSKQNSIVLIVIAVLVILGGAYYFYHAGYTWGSRADIPESTTALPSGANTSDASLEEDLGSIDTQLDALGTDAADVDASVAAHASGAAQ